jgi:hypothetical protein
MFEMVEFVLFMAAFISVWIGWNAMTDEEWLAARAASLKTKREAH